MASRLLLTISVTSFLGIFMDAISVACEEHKRALRDGFHNRIPTVYSKHENSSTIGSLKLQCALWICTVRAATFDKYRYITRVKKTNMAALTVHFH